MWEEFGFLEGLDDDIKKETAAKMEETVALDCRSLHCGGSDYHPAAVSAS